jgi:DNA-binding FadR family transcriptional regulator
MALAKKKDRGSDRPSEIRPKHAADPVFEQLAAAIIGGSIAPGSALPSERELAERFSVSRLIVRQAVHKLADIGLARVRQGGASLVVHPNDARDLRVIELVYRLGQPGAREMREMLERQFLHGFALLSLAARRASKERLRSIADIAEDYARRGAPEEEIPAFERRFFGALAEATDNRFYMLETSWWFRMVEGAKTKRRAAFDAEKRAGFYREIGRRLVEGKDARSAADYYLDSLSPILDMLGSWALLAERPQK